MEENIFKIIIKAYEDILEHYLEMHKISKKHNFSHNNIDKITRYVKKKQRLIDHISSKHKLLNTLWEKSGIDITLSEFEKASKINSEIMKNQLFEIFNKISDLIVEIESMEENKIDMIKSMMSSISDDMSVVKNKKLINKYSKPIDITRGNFINKKNST